MPDITLKFARTGSTVNAEVIDFNVSGNAVFGIDYSVADANSFNTTQGRVTIPAGQTFKNILVTPITQVIPANRSLSIVLGTLSSGSPATPNSFTKTIPIPSAAEVVIALTFASNGDDKGVFNYIGKQDSGTWVNPANSQLQVLRSSGTTGALSALTDRATGAVSTNDVANSWFVFDLGSRRNLKVNNYSFRHRSTANEGLTTWRLEGTNSLPSWDVTGIGSAGWTTIDSRSIASVNTAADLWSNYAVTGQTTGYRYLRLIQTGVNSGGNNVLHLGEVEFYGSLSESPRRLSLRSG